MCPESAYTIFTYFYNIHTHITRSIRTLTSVNDWKNHLKVINVQNIHQQRHCIVDDDARKADTLLGTLFVM